MQTAIAPVNGYVTTPLFAEGRPALDGFDIVADTADRSLWLALFAPKASPRRPKKPPTWLCARFSVRATPAGGSS